MFRLWPHTQEDLVWRPSPIPNGPLNERRIANRFKAYLYTSPFAQSTPHILNFKLLVEMSTQPQALQDCFLQL
jgi:hypothetical protein